MMYLQDSMRVMVFAIFLLLTLRFFVLAWRTSTTHKDDPVVQQHFLEHAVAGLSSFIGSAIGTVWSLVHLFSPHQGELTEGPFSLAIFCLLISGILFMMHMIKEQTPGHPFYQREVGHCARTKAVEVAS